MQTNKHHPAFPCLTENEDYDTIPMEGLTKREFFAIMALQGILASKNYFESVATHKAVSLADELIKALNEQ
jgi:hypothetical protein